MEKRNKQDLVIDMISIDEALQIIKGIPNDPAEICHSGIRRHGVPFSADLRR